MSVVRDILRSYRAPREVFQRRVAGGPREDRALAVLMGGCVVVFVAQWPRLTRLAFETGQELNPLLGGALFAWLFIMPLVLYALGTTMHLLARAMRGHGSAYRARFALFWALLCASPLWLFWGLTVGFIGTGPAVFLTGFIGFAAFLLFWSINFREAEWG
ncbi:YIP1 family protein [Aliiroseovarius subalbicans]|uniref:YIP1 family protein n=1 Tax=Aliiroseovarius subalbicans TaxID=2925840 RepID=UPI001F586FDF|nr:YIP1 family protein [Aliiroseovarius subalbicans]MCI2398400.1 YIP1 family protein [Aliiroseovarius subalbicans]